MMTSPFARARVFTPACVVAWMLAASTVSLFAQAPPAPLFQDSSAAATVNRAPDATSERTVTRSREIVIDFAQMSAPGASFDARATLLLNLFPDATYTAALDRVDRTGGGFVWVGHIPSIELSTVTLAIDNGVMYGSVYSPDATFLIKPLGGGVHTVQQIDQGQFPPDGPIRIPTIAPPDPRRGLRGAAADPQSGDAQGDDGSLIDVMVVYTPAAATAAGGVSAMNALIANAISTTNTTYANSGIIQRLRLVYSTQVAYTETGGSTGIETDLYNISGGAGAFSGIAAIRDASHADLVSLLTNTPGSSYCGIAWKMDTVSTGFAPNGYSVVEQSCAVGNLSFPHELGHNMGAGHDWYVDNDLQPTTYAHGYVNLTGRWRTVMAYNNLCPVVSPFTNCSRLAYWANPGLFYGGLAMGVAGGTRSDATCYANPANPACDADDHRTLNDTALTVANFRIGGVIALTATSLTANVTFPRPAGSSVTWTAAATGGTAPYTYKFLVYNGSTWSVGQDWSGSSTFVWTPVTPGSYTLQVWVRNAGSANVYDAWLGAGPNTITVAPLTLLSVTPSTSTAAAGSPVTWTASATGGTAPYSYVFLVYDGVSWSVGQTWSASNTWTWKPRLPGSYSFQVWARSAGSSAAYDAYRAFGPYTVTVPAALTLTGLNPSLPQYIPAGTPVTWTATAFGGTAPYTYRFMVYNGSTWTVGQEYAAPNTWTWTPSTSGYYWVQVWARNAGSVAAYDTWIQGDSYYVAAASPLSISSFTADRTFPVPAGTPIKWKAAAVGGTAPYSYRFVVFNGSAWSVGQEYSPSDTWTFTPPAAGSTYQVQVWAKSAGSGALYDAWQGSGSMAVSAPTALSVPTLTMTPLAPLPVGATATFTSTATGGSGPYTYKFYLFNGSTWSVGQDWSASNTWSWVPSAPGTYTIQVWVRNNGSVAVYDQWQGMSSVTVTP